MPSLTIQPSVLHPERAPFYCITLQSGSGFEGGPWMLDQAAIGNIERTIRAGVEMHEATIDGFRTMADVEEFIEPARECFEAS